MWHVIQKWEGASQHTEISVKTVRDCHSKDNINTEHQTYELLCSSFTFTQASLCNYRTVYCISLPCFTFYEILYAQVELKYYKYYFLSKAPYHTENTVFLYLCLSIQFSAIKINKRL
jgi:hypothetical protein